MAVQTVSSLSASRTDDADCTAFRVNLTAPLATVQTVQ